MSPLEIRAEGEELKNHSKQEVDSIVDSLIGVLADDGKSLQEYREERLAKYEPVELLNSIKE